jgi:hypothetical protein
MENTTVSCDEAAEDPAREEIQQNVQVALTLRSASNSFGTASCEQHVGLSLYEVQTNPDVEQAIEVYLDLHPTAAKRIQDHRLHHIETVGRVGADLEIPTVSCAAKRGIGAFTVNKRKSRLSLVRS